MMLHLNTSFFPYFSAVKHAETQSTNEDLAANIDKGKIFFKIFLCADQTIMNIMSYRDLIIFLPEFTFFFERESMWSAWDGTLARERQNCSKSRLIEICYIDEGIM